MEATLMVRRGEEKGGEEKGGEEKGGEEKGGEGERARGVDVEIIIGERVETGKTVTVPGLQEEEGGYSWSPLEAHMHTHSARPDGDTHTRAPTHATPSTRDILGDVYPRAALADEEAERERAKADTAFALSTTWGWPEAATGPARGASGPVLKVNLPELEIERWVA
eukprot:1330616-Rhodomonas_salina.1